VAILDVVVFKKVPFMKWLFLHGRRKNALVPCMSQYNFVRRLRDGSKRESFSSVSWQRCPRLRGSF
jgi:hypothetical protein